MPRLSRRSFVTWSSALAAALGLRGRVAEAAPGIGPADDVDRGDGGRQAPQAPSLDEAMVASLAAAVLPSELGTAGASGAARRFTRWIDGYRAGAEVLHPYGSPDITQLPPSPAAAWRRQLAALDVAARRAHGAGFSSLGVPQRQALVRAALAGTKLSRMPGPLTAPHVAVALMSHFFASPEGTDLCYRAQIRKGECRPLATASREPLPLAGGPA